jgi:hypothetical protein
MKIEFVCVIVLWLNAFQVKSGISATYLPRELLLRWRLDYKMHCRVLPETYCKVHDEPVPTNMMAWCTHECIALGLMGNLQGSMKFYCLTTGRVLKRRSFTPMPMPDRVIKRVNAIGERKGQGCTFRFLDRCKEPYKWTDSVPEDDPEFQGLLDDKEEAANPEISAELPGVELEEEEPDFTPVTDEPEADFCDLAGAALHNAGINADDCIRAALGAAAEHSAPAVIESNEDELVYKVRSSCQTPGLFPLPTILLSRLGTTATIPSSPPLSSMMLTLCRMRLLHAIQHELAGVQSAVNHTTNLPHV